MLSLQPSDVTAFSEDDLYLNMKRAKCSQTATNSEFSSEDFTPNFDFLSL